MEEKSLEEIMSDLQVEPLDESTSEVVKEVQDMIDSNSFVSKNIDKDMNVIEKEYITIARKADSIDQQIEKIKQDNANIFQAIADLEAEKEQVLAPVEDYRELITRKLSMMEDKKWKGLEVDFTYVAPTYKDTFNKKRFQQEQPVLYHRYVDRTPVKDFVRTKLHLLSVGGNTNGNEDIK